MGRDKTRDEARLTASELRELGCSWRLIVFELSAKYGYARSDAEAIAHEAFRHG